MRSLAVITCLLAVLAATNAQARDTDTRGYIEVTGEAQSVMVPDVALLELSVMREASTAREALDANSKAMADVLAAMRDAGVEDKDLQTSNFAISPNYVYPRDRDDTGPRIVGYTVRNGLTVRVRQIEKLGRILDTSVSLGVNEGGSVRFTNDDPSVAIAVARTLAVKNALGKAGGIAEAAGVKLGDILSITEHAATPEPRPMRMEAKMAAVADSAVPVAIGENTYHVSVELRVAIDR